MAARETDEELRRLLKEASAGDAEALDALFSRLYPYVLRVIRAYGAPAADADDIAAETFLRVFEAMKSKGGEVAHPAPYLAAVARHLVVRELRQRRTAGASVSILDEAAELHAGVDLAREVETADALARALDLLDEHDRLLVQMLVEGHSTREIAERIGLPTDVVNVRLARARKRLAASLTSG